jgi:hypothetical protein
MGLSGIVAVVWAHRHAGRVFVGAGVLYADAASRLGQSGAVVSYHVGVWFASHWRGISELLCRGAIHSFFVRTCGRCIGLPPLGTARSGAHLLAGVVVGGVGWRGWCQFVCGWPAWAMGLPPDVVASLATKSVTAPVAMGIAEKIGGVPALAAVFASITGIVSALIGKFIFDRLGIARTRVGWMARGFALGTAGHGVGAARAMQVNPDAGAMAGLALGLQVLLATVLIPLCNSLL